jgi:hypothetical protein
MTLGCGSRRALRFVVVSHLTAIYSTAQVLPLQSWRELFTPLKGAQG